MNTFLKQIGFVLLLLTAGLVSQPAHASHYAAVDLYVTYIGEGADGCSGTNELKYEVTLDIYANCGPNSASLGPTPSADVKVWSDQAGYDTTYRVDNPERDTVDELCPQFKPINACQPGGNPLYTAYAKDRYVFTVILPSQQEDWKFSWTNGGRNTVLNLSTQGQSIYVEACLNNKIKYNNSTPRFMEPPLPYICVNQPAAYLNDPLDPNNDSLIVATTVPLNNNANNPIPYDNVFPNNYSVNDPIGSDASNPYKLNPVTGTATFTPTAKGQFVLAFRCDEYQRGTGKPMGYILRDVQISIFDCTTPPPPIDDKPQNISGGKYVTKGTGDDAISALLVCPGSNLSFDVSAKSDDPNALVYLETNISAGNLATATFSIPASGPNSNGSTNPIGTFGWTPTVNDLGDHTLVVRAKDSTCTGTGFALVLRNYQVLLIRVVPGLDAGPDLPICAIDPQSRQLFVRGTEALNHIVWENVDGGPAENLSATNIPNPIASPKNTTVYLVRTEDLEEGGCRTRDTVSVYIDESNTVDVVPNSPLVVCRPDYLQLDAIVTGKGPISNMACGINNKNLNPECDEPDSIAIFGDPLYGKIAYDSTGIGTPILQNLARSSKMQFLINRKDMKEYGMRSATIKSISFETAHNGDAGYQYNNFRISMKCTKKESLSASDGFETNMSQVYEPAGSVTFPDGIHEFTLTQPYNWDTSQNLIIEFCYSNNPTVYAGSCNNPNTPKPPVIKFAPTNNFSMLSYFPTTFDPVTVPGGSWVPDSNRTDICGVLYDKDISQRLFRPVVGFKYCDAPYNPFTIKWSPGNLMSDSTIMQPLTYVQKSITYVLESFGNSGCLLRDSVEVYVPTHNFEILPEDTSVCLGEVSQMSINNASAAIWHEYVNGEFQPGENSLNCVKCLNPVASPKVTTTYKVEIADSVWCFDTLDVTVNVLPLPDVKLLTNDTIVKYGQRLQLQATGARMYNWTPPASLDNPNISYPVATPTEPTVYVVGGIASNGCRSYDTVRVGIDYRDNLLIPTAFTPNGDGKNDNFRIANMTFQRVMEFRVFNRWGQEVYSANDNKGWDGKWQGTPQDMGNYQYSIRLGYPDGYVESYKGEVTLIR